MINFRFHIISLTAAFLAFTVGLLLGTNFLADASKDYLQNQIDSFANRLSDEKATNRELKGQIDSLEDEDKALDPQIGERLFTGLLQSDPVLIIAPRGLTGDPNPVDRVTQTLLQASAQPLGVWWLTDRLVLDDDEEVTDLSTALGVTTTDPDALRQELADQLGEALITAVAAASGDGGNAEPALLAKLHEAGFVDYQMPEGSDDEVIRLPANGLRISVVTGDGAVIPDEDVLQPTLEALAADGPVPVVVSETPVEAEDSNADPTEPLVTAIRQDGDLRTRISTVDDMDRVSGRVATVLALDDAKPGAPVIGQYGMRVDASRLLPTLPTE